MRESARLDTELIAAANVTMIDSCSLIASLLDGSCLQPALSLAGVEEHLFPLVRKDGDMVRDTLHQAAPYSALQGCLAATALLQAEGQPPAKTAEPAADAVNAAKANAGFCLQARAWPRDFICTPTELRVAGH